MSESSEEIDKDREKRKSKDKKRKNKRDNKDDERRNLIKFFFIWMERNLKRKNMICLIHYQI